MRWDSFRVGDNTSRIVGFAVGQGLELELIPVLLQRHPDQLASRSNASFGEELLQRSLDCGLRNLQSVRDLLVGQSFKDERKHLSLALGELRATLVRAGHLGFFQCPPK